jgi:hypothetical protein
MGWGNFVNKGVESEQFKYGSLAVYGFYSLEEPGWTDFRKGIKNLTHKEARELSEEQKAGKNLHYHTRHIGLTTRDGRVISKWGKGKLGFVIEGPPHIVPHALGEVDYVSFTTKLPTVDGEKEIFIMPRYEHDTSSSYNMELVLTDGMKQVGHIRGLMHGTIGRSGSVFSLLEKVDYGTYDYQVPEWRGLDGLTAGVGRYLEETAPMFFGKLEGID